MSTEKKNATEGQNVADSNVEQTATGADTTQADTKKVSRRGIASARGTTRLKFSHEHAMPNGLFLGHLESVAVSKILIGEASTGLPSFNGMEIPKITLLFTSNEDDVNKRHYATVSFSAVESNVLTIPGAKEEWKLNAIFDYIKHILNVYVLKGRELTEAEENALSLPFEDFDEEGNYSPVDVEDVIAGYTTFFENVENILNRGKEGNPVYKTKDGKIIPIWMKLLRYTKNAKKGWQPLSNGDLVFPTFIGEGVIELFAQNTKPSIRVDAVKEAIRPMDIEKAKAPNMMGGPSIMGAGGPVGMGYDPNAGFNNMSAAAGEDDLPF